MPGSAVEAGAGPHAAPDHFGEESLEIGVERGRVRLRARDMLVSKHSLADAHAPLERIV